MYSLSCLILLVLLVLQVFFKINQEIRALPEFWDIVMVQGQEGKLSLCPYAFCKLPVFFILFLVFGSPDVLGVNFEKLIIPFITVPDV